MIQRFELFCTSAFSIYRSILKIERMEMEKFGLKGPHAQCLVIMDRYPEGITSARLCEICERDKAAISRTVAELEEAGLLTRREQNGIHYRVPLTLTEEGREAARNVNAVASQAVEQAGYGLDDGERQVFYKVLGQIAQNLQTISRDGLKERR